MRLCLAPVGRCGGDVWLPLRLQRTTATHITYTHCAARSNDRNIQKRLEGVAWAAMSYARPRDVLPVGPQSGFDLLPLSTQRHRVRHSAFQSLHDHSCGGGVEYYKAWLMGVCGDLRSCRSCRHLVVDFVDTEAVFPGTSTQPTGMMVCDICATTGPSGSLASFHSFARPTSSLAFSPSVPSAVVPKERQEAIAV